MAMRARKRDASAMRNIHVPVYWPVVWGVQEREKRGVVVEVKKVMDMVDMVMEVEEFVEEEEEGMDMSMVVSLGGCAEWWWCVCVCVCV